MIFDENVARAYDDWLQTPAGVYVDRREKSLILSHLLPREGERLLDVGCGTGDHLALFRAKGCAVSGIDPSPPMLARAREKLGSRADLRLGTAEDLPFSDNEFDVVTLVTSLEFTADPERAVAEAIRVCRGRVFLGVLNRWSVIALSRRLADRQGPTIYRHARFFTAGELRRLVRKLLPGSHIQWGSMVFLPYGWYPSLSDLEEVIPITKNPFGAFLGLSFPVTFSSRTIQEPLRISFGMEPRKQRPIPGAIRVIK
jgi:ubiquinone/menaquinone biosynthesis C-methylase UbiE